MTALLQLPDAAASDAHRKRLLREADDLLGRVEELRMAGRRVLPRDLHAELRDLQVRLGRPGKPVRRVSLDTAQDTLFALQQRLMAANPRRPSTRAHVGRAHGSPVVEAIRPGVSWKLLVLPGRPTSAEHERHWRELVWATVDRALERWFYAHHRAVHAARENARPVAALMVDRVAWNNYWELREEAARLVPERVP